jgi:hypothetical protein
MLYDSHKQTEKLKEALALIVKELQEQGLLPELKNKKEMLEDVIEKVAAKILEKCPRFEHNLDNGAFRKALSLAIMTEFVIEAHPGNKNIEKLSYENLFDKSMQTTTEMQLELTKHFALLLTALNELIPKPELRFSQENIQQHAERLALNTTQKLEEDSLAENEEAINCTCDLTNDLLAETLSNLFGQDPRIAGSPMKYIFVFKGNLNSIVDQNGENDLSNAPIDALNRYDGKSDPHGTKNTIRERMEDISAVIETNLKALPGFHPEPKAT